MRGGSQPWLGNPPITTLLPYIGFNPPESQIPLKPSEYFPFNFLLSDIVGFMEEISGFIGTD